MCFWQKPAIVNESAEQRSEADEAELMREILFGRKITLD